MQEISLLCIHKLELSLKLRLCLKKNLTDAFARDHINRQLSFL